MLGSESTAQELEYKKGVFEEDVFYSCADLWCIDIYEGIFEPSGKVKGEDVEDILIELSSKFSESRLKEIEQKFGGKFKDYKVDAKLRKRYLRFPHFAHKYNGANVNIRMRINPCLSPNTNTKISTLVDFETDLPFNEIIKFFFNYKKEASGINRELARDYINLSIKRGLSISEDPIYHVVANGIGVDHEVARDLIYLSKKEEDIITFARADAKARRIIDDINSWESKFQRKKATEWLTKIVYDAEWSNAQISGRKLALGTYGLYQNPNQADLFIFAYGKHKQVHELTKQIVLSFIYTL